MAAYTYVGNPGYTHNLAAGVKSLEPGDVVDLTDEEAGMYGDAFTAAKSKTKTAPVADDTEGAKP